MSAVMMRTPLARPRVKAPQRAGTMLTTRVGAIPAAGQTSRRRASKANAARAKAAGAGSTNTSTHQTSLGLGDILKGAAVGFASGGIGGAIAGGVAGAVGGRPSRPTRARGLTSSGSGFEPAMCPDGRIRLGDNCIDPFAFPPGGDPFNVPTTGTDVTGAAAPGAPGAAVVGAFNLPAIVPRQEMRFVRKCPRGMVLGVDNLCYPKSELRSNSRRRKHRRPARPPVTRSDVRAINRAASARDRVAELAKDVGLHVRKSAPRRKK